MQSTRTRLRAAAVAALALLGAAAAAACNDKQFLTEVPYDFVGPSNFYQNAGDAVAAINGVYGSLINSSGDNYYGRNFVMLAELPAEAVTTYLSATNERSLVDNFTFTPSQSYIYSTWQSAYAAVNRANSVIERVPGIAMDSSLKTRIVGEAKFLRALNYFNLVRLFGDVPLRLTETTSLDSLSGTRDPAASVYAAIVKDLQDAAAVLPAKYTGTDVGRATKGAAQSLLVKVYLQRAGTGVGTPADYQAALELSRQVTQSGTYALVANPATLWDFVGDPASGTAAAAAENNSEVIFDIQNTRQQGLGGRIGNHFAPRNSTWEASQNGSFEAESTFYASFASSDKRRAATFVLSFPSNKKVGTVVSYAANSTASGDYGADTPYLKKFIDPQLVSAGQEEPNYIILRYADVLLMQAEAANEVGGPTTEAYTALNAVRTRAGIPAVSGLTQQAFKDSVFVERRRELVGEGPNAYFDSQRYWSWASARITANMARGKANSFKNSRFPKAQVTLDDHFRLMPIPQRARDLNPQLTQNAGYAGAQ